MTNWQVLKNKWYVIFYNGKNVSSRGPIHQIILVSKEKNIYEQFS